MVRIGLGKKLLLTFLHFDIDPTAVFLVELTGIIPVRSQPWRKKLMTNRWSRIYLSLLLQIPGSLLAQSLPSLLPNPFNGALTTQGTSAGQAELGLSKNSLTILPEDGRALYFRNSRPIH